MKVVKSDLTGTPLVVQWLRLHDPNAGEQGASVQSLVREHRSHTCVHSESLRSCLTLIPCGPTLITLPQILHRLFISN